MNARKRAPAQGKPREKERVRGRARADAGWDALPAWAWYAALFALTLLAYFRTFSFSYSGFDDVLLIKQNTAFLSHFANAVRVFGMDVFLGKSSSLFYRPMQALSYMIDFAIGGAAPQSNHVTNVLLHAAASCSLFAFLVAYGIRKTTAGCFAALFAVHPLFAQLVAWLPSRGDLLLALFGSWAAISFRAYRERGNAAALGVHLACVACAALSKESALALPALFAAEAWLFGDATAKRKRLPLAAAGWAVIAIGWFALRSAAIKAHVHDNVFGFGPLAYNMQTIPVAVAKAILPLGLAPMPLFTVLDIALGLALLGGLSYLALRAWRRGDRRTVFGALWFLVLLAPTLVYRHERGVYGYDYLTHRLYLPVFGLFLALAVSASAALFTRTRLLAGTLALALVFGIDAASLAAHYADEDVFDAYAIGTNPQCAIALNNRGNHRSTRGDIPGAIEDFNAALRLVPNDAHALTNRASEYKKLGRRREALADLDLAIRIAPAPIPLYNRGLLYTDLGKYDAALADFQRMIDLAPAFAVGYTGRGYIRALKGDTAGALDDYNEAIRIEPAGPRPYSNRAGLLRGMARLAQAAADYETVIRMTPDDPVAYANLANVRADERRFSDAVALYTKSIEVRPTALAYLNRGNLKKNLGDLRGARADWTDAARLGSDEATMRLRASAPSPTP